MRFKEKYLVILQPYSEHPETAFNTAKIIYSYFANEYPNKVIFSPILHTHQVSKIGNLAYNYYLGQDLALYEIFPKDDTRFLFFGDISESRGCKAEMKWCKENGRKYTHIKTLSAIDEGIFEDLKFKMHMLLSKLYVNLYSMDTAINKMYSVVGAYEEYINSQTKNKIANIIMKAVDLYNKNGVISEDDIERLLK